MSETTTNVTLRNVKTAAGTKLYTSKQSVASASSILAYRHAMLRAWDQLELSAILAVDGLPTLYLKEAKRKISAADANKFQKDFWNQGIATVFVIADPVVIRIFSGMAPPSGDQAGDENPECLIQALENADLALRLKEISAEMATGQFYRKFPEHFDPQSTVDSYLLENIGAVRDVLTAPAPDHQSLEPAQAHSFIGRVLFACYLIDRGIVNLRNYEFGGAAKDLRELLEPLGFRERKETLYSLFKDLRDHFNGNMFDRDLESECRAIRKVHMDAVVEFLQGHPLKEKQRSLGFWAYNFKLIPVETISAIYEDFLEKEDQIGKRKAGAYYTPRFLAELVVDAAMEHVVDYRDQRFTDPACGSGIFLVVLFNRLASIWQADNPRAHYRTKARELLRILEEQLHGVDKNLTACRIACFSLYLAFLDQFDPPDIQDYIERTGNRLPSILRFKETENHALDFPVVFEDDFLEPSGALPDNTTVFIGNPPWAGRGSKQIALKFMQRVGELLPDNGTACLLLPSKVFLNQTDSFQRDFLISVTVDRVIQLADYRKILFTNARTPTSVVRFRAGPPDLSTLVINYDTPKVSVSDLRQGVIPILPCDRKELTLRHLLAAADAQLAPVVWKQNLWGTPRDLKFLELLMSMPKLSGLVGMPDELKRWIKGQGFQPYYDDKVAIDSNYPSPKPIEWDLSDSFIDARNKNLGLVLLPDDCITLGNRLEKIGASQDNLRRSPDNRLFQPPLLLISQGYDSIAFCDFNVRFQHSLQSVSGPKKDEDLLIFLTVYLRSRLARYFLFHTSANWGTERDKVHLEELLRLPFPLPGNEHVSEDAAEIVREVAGRVKQFRQTLTRETRDRNTQSERDKFKLQSEAQKHQRVARERKQRADELQAELDSLIYRYFDLIDQEIILIEDTANVYEPSATPNKRSEQIPTLEPINRTAIISYASGLEAYAVTLSSTLNEWAEQAGGSTRVCATGTIDQQAGLAMLTLTQKPASGPPSIIESEGELATQFASLFRAGSKQIGSLDYLRGLIVHDNSTAEIHIGKPIQLANWTRTAALNDAAQIYAIIVNERAEKNARRG